MHLLWFRRDLRLADNEIVTLATADGAGVLPFFIIDPWFYTWADVGTARVRFLFESLQNLNFNLQKLGSRLYLFEGNSTDIVQELTKQLTERGYKPKLFFNRDVQVDYGIKCSKFDQVLSPLPLLPLKLVRNASIMSQGIWIHSIFPCFRALRANLT